MQPNVEMDWSFGFTFKPIGFVCLLFFLVFVRLTHFKCYLIMLEVICSFSFTLSCSVKVMSQIKSNVKKKHSSKFQEDFMFGA